MGKVTLITGATSGMGKTTALLLAGKGYDVYAGARKTADGEVLVAEAKGRGIPLKAVQVDVPDDASIRAAVSRVAKESGRLDNLVNNAGFGLDLAFESNDIEDEARHLALHVEVPMRLMRAVLPGMLERGSGRIVNVASVAGFIPRSTYGACKGWLISFSRWANGRYAPRGVTVTAVCPGFTHTGFHERMGLAPGNEGVPAALWLDASDVVSESLGDIARGKAVSVPSLRYKALVALIRLVPPSLAARVGESGR